MSPDSLIRWHLESAAQFCTWAAAQEADPEPWPHAPEFAAECRLMAGVHLACANRLLVLDAELPF